MRQGKQQMWTSRDGRVLDVWKGARSPVWREQSEDDGGETRWWCAGSCPHLLSRARCHMLRTFASPLLNTAIAKIKLDKLITNYIALKRKEQILRFHHFVTVFLHLTIFPLLEASCVCRTMGCVPAPVFTSPCSVTSCWYLHVRHSDNVCTTEIGQFYRAGTSLVLLV